MEPFFDQIPVSGLAEHRFLEYEKLNVRTEDARKLAAYILNRYSNRSQSVKQYKGKLIKFSAKNNSTKGQVKFDDIVCHIIETGSFDHQKFNFTPLSSSLLDSTAVQHTIPAVGVSFRLPTDYPNFPLTPTLESEGMVFTSFQTPIQQNILRLHRILVEDSDRIVNERVLEWVNDMRMLLNDCISLVDITLHQVYFAAEYNLRPEWKFDASKLGSRTGVRITDKLRWIGQITGKPLDNAVSELKSFNVLRGVRNHLNHFDPPCVAISVDDAADWLNRISSIGFLLWKIRSKLDAQLTRELIEMALGPKVKVVPQIQSSARLPQRDGAGYSSSVWSSN